MSSWGPMLAGGALSLGGALLGGKKKQKPLFDLTNAYYTGLNQQNEQRGMALGALDRFGDFTYGTRTPKWSPFGASPYYNSMPGNYSANRVNQSAGTASGGKWGSLKTIAGVSDRVPGFNPPGTGYELPLPWGMGTQSLMDYQGGAIGGGGPSYLEMIAGAGADRTRQMNDLAAQYFSESGRIGGDADALYQQAVGEARGYGDRALSEIEQQYSDTVRRESDRLSGQLASRGFGGSTMLQADVANSIIPNALGGKLSALSNTRNAQAGMVTNAALARASAKQASGESELARRYGLIPQQLATSDAYAQQYLGAYAEPERMRANVLGQPSAAYFGPYTRGNIQNAGNFQPQGYDFGDRLAGVGGQLGGMLLNYGMADYFGRPSNPWDGAGKWGGGRRW